MQFEYDLISAMREYDLFINSINLEAGKYHRFRSIGTCKTKCCEYRIFENHLGAHFKCFRRGIDRFWFANSERQHSMEDRRQMAEERSRIERERKAHQTRMAAKCEAFFDKDWHSPHDHPYVQRKQIFPHYAKQVRRMLVLPVHNIHREMQSLQFIKRNGFKQFKTGAPSSEGMIWLCEPLAPDYAGVIRICEGWSTGCTIRMITKSPVVCALNAYNLPKVAKLLRAKYPNMILKICADNDQWGKENTGMQCALKADIEGNGIVYWPTFDGFDTSNHPTDFNDLFIIAGAYEVKRQLIRIKI